MAEVRTFVAIEFSAELQREIGQIQSKLKGELSQLKWVAKSNFHLTLKFLGDVDQRKIPMMAVGLKKAIRGLDSFSLGFAGVSGFPGIHLPRVIWLGVSQGNTELVRLQKKVDQELVAQGFESEKRAYHPHLTLARSKPETDLAVVGKRLSQIKVEATRMDLIKSIRIMKSDLHPGGPIYTCLEEIFF